ncbi:MAG: hypothetical protein GTN81_02305 [Proteobacteria bacterium]|nr:hypothetical protein [Pseudomonadota bacterium]
MAEATGQEAKRSMEEIMEDYALRKAPDFIRSTPAAQFGMFGIPMCMYYLAVGSLSVAFAGLWLGILATLIAYGVFIIFASVFGYVSWKGGYSFDMIARFSWGQTGSFLPSLLAMYLLMSFWALETHWMSVAFQKVWPLGNIWWFYLMLFPLFIVVPIFGHRALAYWNYIAVPLGIFATIYVLYYFYGVQDFTAAKTISMSAKGIIPGGFGAALDWSLAAVGLWAVTAGNFGRFVKSKGWAIGIGPFQGFFSHIVFPIAGIFLVWPMIAALTPKIGAEAAGQTAFLPSIPFAIAMGWVGVLIVITYQLNIQYINAYLPSVNLANFFSVIAKWEPGRKWWVVLVNIFGLLLLAVGIIEWITHWAWTASLTLGTACVISLADIFYRWSKKIPTEYEVIPTTMRLWNPMAFLVFAICVVVGLLDKLWWNLVPSPSIIAYPLAFVLYWIISARGEGKYQKDIGE